MNKNIYIIIGGIFLLILAFFLGRMTVDTDIKTIDVKIPEVSKTIPIVFNPKPIYKTKDSLVYKDTTIYTEGEYNKKLAQDYLDLEKRYADMDLEKERLKKYLESIQIRDYKIPYDDEFVSITNNITAQGEVLSFQQEYKLKERTVKAEVPVKVPKLAVLVGGELGNTIQFDKFVAKGNLMIQNKKGNILSASYDTEERIWIGYAFKF